VPTTPELRAIRVPHATEVTPYWGPTEAGGRTGQCSTLEHHPTRTADHSRRAADPGVGAALHHTPEGMR
jgi:hypothetical protein